MEGSLIGVGESGESGAGPRVTTKMEGVLMTFRFIFVLKFVVAVLT